MILRAHLKAAYRGVLGLLAVSPDLREALGMRDKLPHYTTLQKFSARRRVLETTTASAHFQSRSGRTRHQWVQVSTIVLCGSLLPLSLVLDWGPGNDKSQAGEYGQGQQGHPAGEAVCRRGI